MRVNAIRPSQRRQDRLLVELEGGELLRLSREEALRLELREGMEVDRSELERRLGALRTRAAAAAMAGRRALSREELLRRLEKKGADGGDARAAADWLEELGAIDDAGYAAALARHYGQRGYGPGRVREELRRRGVDRGLWEEALAELPEAAEAIDRFLAGKLRGRLPDEGEKRRLSDALLRRGFSWGDVRAAWDRLGSETPEE